MPNLFIVSGNPDYTALGEWCGFNIVTSVEAADIVMFTGGEDVSPEVYGAKTHHYTSSSKYRDEYEGSIFAKCVRLKKSMVGICRGGQFLNCMNGGAMYQHVTRHTHEHLIKDHITGETLLVSSTHHQMMKPTSKAVLVASSRMLGSREWYEGERYHEDVCEEDIEIVFYPQTKSLCFQPHPEFAQTRYSDMKKYFSSLLTRYNLI